MLLRNLNRPIGNVMQNRYVGDIGDYMKLGILRALSPGYRLGVAWWLFPDEGHNQDGKRIHYLKQAEHWRQYDPELFDALDKIVSSGKRNVRALEGANILPNAIFANDVVPRQERLGNTGLGTFGVSSKQPTSHSWTLTTGLNLTPTVLVPRSPARASCSASYRTGEAGPLFDRLSPPNPA
jgi:hypothetical protein